MCCVAFIAIPLVAGSVRGYVWLYVVGPLVGAMAGVIVMHILMPALGEEETRAVVGAYCQATHVQHMNCTNTGNTHRQICYT
jgi:hypothetical protein